MNICVLDGYTLNPGDNPWTAIESFGSLKVYESTPGAAVIDRCRGAEIVLTNKTPLTAQVLKQLPDLRLISVLATGHNIVDSSAARELGIAVSNVPEYGTPAVAQFTFALLLELCHHVGHHNQAVHAGRWQVADHFCFWDYPLTELAGKQMGILGFGRIGRQVGAIAQAFGMSVLAHSTTRSQTADYPFEWCDLKDLLSRSDVISLHCPLTDTNHEMINAETLGPIKPSAFLINTARGGLINEPDLANALHDKRLAGFAGDVLSIEPAQSNNPLLKAPNALITPHIAWASLEARKRLMAQTAENIRAFINGTPINMVN